MTPPSFSERENGPKPRTRKQITPQFWGGVIALVRSGLSLGYFAQSYPQICPDGPQVIASDVEAFGLVVTGLFPELGWPLLEYQPPTTDCALDLVEFLCQHASLPVPTFFHEWRNHWHLDAFRRDGSIMRDKVNQLFAANEMAFEVTARDEVRYLVAPPVTELLTSGLPVTSDPDFDDLLGLATRKFLSRKAGDRHEALEHLWDAFERMKTIPDPAKSRGSEELVRLSATDPSEAELLTAEMKVLTTIGNRHRIRHHETDKLPISDALAEYLFLRMFVLIERLHPGIAPRARR